MRFARLALERYGRFQDCELNFRPGPPDLHAIYGANEAGTGTYLARYDDLVTKREDPIDVSNVAVSMIGIELQDREFVAAIREGREPNSSVAQVLDCYRVIGELGASLERQDGWS